MTTSTHYPIMRTVVQITLHIDGSIDGPTAEDIDTAIVEELNSLETTFSAFNPESELSTWRIGQIAVPSNHLETVLAAALRYQLSSGGRFNPLAGEISQVWAEATRSGEPPDRGAGARPQEHPQHEHQRTRPALAVLVVGRRGRGGLRSTPAATCSIAVEPPTAIRSGRRYPPKIRRRSAWRTRIGPTTTNRRCARFASTTRRWRRRVRLAEAYVLAANGMAIAWTPGPVSR